MTMTIILRIPLFLLPGFLLSCNPHNKEKATNDQVKAEQISPTPGAKEISFKTRFNSFDTTVEVLFWDTKDSISDMQKKNFEGFISKQDLLTPEILKKVFEFYKDSYQDYKSGWTAGGNIATEELEKMLPRPTSPDALKKFITPAIVHIQNKEECKPGTIGIEFDCTWDIEYGLGVKIKNWQVVEAGVAETSYFFKGDSR